MKTIIEIATDISKYIFEDDAEVSLDSDSITTPSFIVADMNSSTAELVEDVTPPADWMGCKYLYADSEWELNPDWVEPEDEDPEV
tara:strand:- start:3352 stop:3606 length:255 start_codon:yes stop_codon:yes gene_type:complete